MEGSLNGASGGDENGLVLFAQIFLRDGQISVRKDAAAVHFTEDRHHRLIALLTFKQRIVHRQTLVPYLPETHPVELLCWISSQPSALFCPA